MRLKIFGRIIYVPKFVIAIIVALIAIICIVIGYFLVNSDKEMPDVSSSPSVSASIDILRITSPSETEPTPKITTNPNIFVHITGKVTNEGVYELSPDSRVETLVSKAGGLLSDADTKAINLAMKLNDGMHIHIPGKYDSDKTWIISEGNAQSSVASEPTSKKVNINTAGIDELMTLSGVGESTAKSIIKYRETNGNFTKIEDIMNVPGIKEAKYAQFCDQIAV